MTQKRAPNQPQPPNRPKPASRPRKVRPSNQFHGLELDRAALCRALHALDDSGLFAVPQGELSVVFLDNERIAALHQEFLDDPSPTDVITFPGDPEMDFAGEICVSAEMAVGYARRHGLDFSKELALYVVHGYLHLAGYDDTEPAARRAMRQAEKKAMNWLEESGRIPEFGLRTAR